MRILFSSDWHLEEKFVVDPKRQSRDVHLLAAQAREIQPDVLIVAGDITWGEDGVYEKYLSLFDDLNCIKLAIAGNHDAAFEVGPRHEEELAMVLADLGFHYLDAAPCCIDGVGFVGTMGWYDGTLSNPTETKAIPISDPFAGGPRVIGSIQPRDAVWTAKMLARLDAHICDIEEHVRAIVAVIHHVPFVEFLDHDLFWTHPIMGSRRFGQLLLSHQKVRACIYGHAHTRRVQEMGGVLCANHCLVGHPPSWGMLETRASGPEIWFQRNPL